MIIRRLAPSAAAVGAAKFDRAPPPAVLGQQLRFRGHDHALGRRDWVSHGVVAIRVIHILVAEPPHGLAALGGDGGEIRRRQGRDLAGAVARRQLVDGVDDAAVEDEVPELGDEGLVPVVDLLLAAVGGP